MERLEPENTLSDILAGCERRLQVFLQRFVNFALCGDVFSGRKQQTVPPAQHNIGRFFDFDIAKAHTPVCATCKIRQCFTGFGMNVETSQLAQDVALIEHHLSLPVGKPATDG